jgi:transcriptional regulator with XRE-family HTH domain
MCRVLGTAVQGQHVRDLSKPCDPAEVKDPHLQEWLLATDGIATQLRSLRGARTGRDFAELAGMRPAKLSKLELGQQMPTEEDIRRIVAVSGEPSLVADELVERLNQLPAVRSEGERMLRFGQVASQRRLNDRLRNAQRVQIFEATYMPRPVQDPDYARLMLSALGRPPASDAEVDLAQSVLTESAQYLFDPRREFEIVIAEPVLRWQTVTAGTMRAQLERLLAAIKAPAVTVRVLPLDTPLDVHPSSSFVLYDGEGFLDSLDEGPELTGSSLDRHQALMAGLFKASLGATRTREVVRTALARIP